MSDNALTTLEKRAAISLAAVYVMRMLGLFMVIPVIAVAATAFDDYSPLLVGFAVGGYGLTQALLQIPFGVLSDKWGRKPVIYLGLCLFCAGSLLAGFADSMLVLTIGRILQGSGAIAGAIMALASDVTRESQRTKVMAIIGVSIGFSFYIALLTGPLLAASIGLNGIFLMTAALSLMCIAAVKWGVILVEQSTSVNTLQAKATGDSLPKLEHIGKLFSHSALWRLNVSVLIVHLLITCFFVQIPVMLLDIKVPLEEHYILYALVLFVSILVLLVFMQLSKSLNVSLLFRLALLTIAVAFFMLIVAEPSYWLISLAGILFFGGFNFMEAKMPAMVSSISPAGQKGSAMGIYASHQFFGAFLGGVLSGLLNSYFEVKTSFIMCLVLIFICALITKGLASVERVKRVTLTIDDNQNTDDILAIKAQLAVLPGVKEVTADAVASAFYLKVDAKQFSLPQAKALIAAEQEAE
uniref:MFS transporter n=1 Tax=Ningiella ruwaisensis TaxID=2364274 RepID=UPI00109FBEFC|nr:MFS transporter [Ningiella ruwaisensis]